MELKRDEIIKALECCFFNHTCDGCPNSPLVDCRRELERDVISLIKELREENERLRNSSIDYRNIPDIKAMERAVTVREMQGMFKGIVEFDIALTDDETNYLLDAIDNIAKELIGEGK